MTGHGDDAIRTIRVVDFFDSLPFADPEAQRAFITYKHYLQHIAYCLDACYSVGEGRNSEIVAATLAQRGVLKLQRRILSLADENRLIKHLRSAWLNEVQLYLPGTLGRYVPPEMLQQEPRQAYYAVLHAAWAMFIASGQPTAPTHASARRTMSSMVMQRKLFPAPLSVYCDGGPTGKEMNAKGWPSHAVSSGPIQNLRSPSALTAWDAFHCALCTTRERAIEEAKQQWREVNKRPRVPAGWAKREASKLPATTLFDFLWRVRTRSDYSDVDAFLSGIATPVEATEYHKALCALVSAVLGILETVVVAAIGHALYEAEVERFVRQVTSPTTAQLQERSAAVLIARRSQLHTI